MSAAACGVRFEVHDDVPEEAGRIVDQGLGEFNARAAPLADMVRLSCFARDGEGQVAGGAVGRTWGACCELQQLWVADAYRARGIGSALLERFEARAAERGCRVVYLDTFSFHAPDFYRARGYRVLAQIGGFPGGIVKIAMLRELTRAEAMRG